MDENVLKLKNFSIRNKGFRLKDINFSLEPGYIYAITGKNGSGKTTLLKAIISEKHPHKGGIVFNGYNPKCNHARAMNEIGFVSEDNQFFEDRTAWQNVEMLSVFFEKFNTELFKEKMDKMNVSYKTTYRNLSRGEKIKFQLAFAFAHCPKFLLLDEATAGMDSVFRTEFFDILREFLVDGGTVLMTTHIVSEIAKQTDYIAFMENGSLGRFSESMEVYECLKEM